MVPMELLGVFVITYHLLWLTAGQQIVQLQDPHKGIYTLILVCRYLTVTLSQRYDFFT